MAVSTDELLDIIADAGLRLQREITAPDVGNLHAPKWHPGQEGDLAENSGLPRFDTRASPTACSKGG